MTNEDAIIMQKAMRDGLHETGKDYPYRDDMIPLMKESCDMAIQALEQQPCEDCVSRKEVINILNSYHGYMGNDIKHEIWNKFKELPSVKPATAWHMIKTRPLTDEEKEVYGKECEFIYDCKMPDDEQEVLIKTDWGIEKTTYYTNDGCFFEDYEGEDDVVAWTELPEWEE